MVLERLRPTLQRDYTACARAYALDLASALLLFFCASVMAGRVWRFAFDDEIYTLSVIERYSAVQLLTIYPEGTDVHPPLSYLLFYGLRYLGLSDEAMRLCSFAMTALALALFHLLALTFIAQRNRNDVSLLTRLVAVLLFGLSALAVSQGDALRWYPLFAILIALFVTFYLAAGNNAMRLCSAVPLGLAASTNYLTAIVILPFALYRYGLQRQFRTRFDAAFWLVAALFASSGIYSAYSLFVHRVRMVGTQFVNSVVQAAMTDVLGFFGGNALGVSQAWIIVPAVVISAVAVVSQIDRRQPANPVHLFLLMLAATGLMALATFAKPRSFLYLAPVLAAVLTLYLDRQARVRAAGVAVLLTSLILIASVGAIANIKGGTHPFKRNAVIPFQQIVDFIQRNGSGNVLVVSTDPVVAWVLQHDRNQPDRCPSYFMRNTRCFNPTRTYDSIFVVSGHSNMLRRAAFMRTFDDGVTGLVAGKRKVVSVPVGLDQDAALKAWLTGVALDKYILTIDHYR